MSSFKSSKRNLSSSSSKDGDNKNKIFVSPNRYASLSEDADPHPEVFSPPPVTTSPQVEDISTHTYMKPPPTTKLHIPPFHMLYIRKNSTELRSADVIDQRVRWIYRADGNVRGVPRYGCTLPRLLCRYNDLTTPLVDSDPIIRWLQFR
ncbi:hypothetical protein ACI65C_004646 [Semiaphis heraclei]